MVPEKSPPLQEVNALRSGVKPSGLIRHPLVEMKLTLANWAIRASLLQTLIPAATSRTLKNYHGGENRNRTAADGVCCEISPEVRWRDALAPTAAASFCHRTHQRYHMKQPRDPALGRKTRRLPGPRWRKADARNNDSALTKQGLTPPVLLNLSVTGGRNRLKTTPLSGLDFVLMSWSALGPGEVSARIPGKMKWVGG